MIASSAGFAAGDKVTYNGAELLCNACSGAAPTNNGAKRPTRVDESQASRPREIAVNAQQLNSPDSQFSTSGKLHPTSSVNQSGIIKAAK